MSLAAAVELSPSPPPPEPRSVTIVPKPYDPPDSNDFEVEAILCHRPPCTSDQEQETHFFAKYVGYSLSESTWEPRCNFADGSSHLLNDYESKNRTPFLERVDPSPEHILQLSPDYSTIFQSFRYHPIYRESNFWLRVIYDLPFEPTPVFEPIEIISLNEDLIDEATLCLEELHRRMKIEMEERLRSGDFNIGDGSEGAPIQIDEEVESSDDEGDDYQPDSSVLGVDDDDAMKKGRKLKRKKKRMERNTASRGPANARQTPFDYDTANRHKFHRTSSTTIQPRTPSFFGSSLHNYPPNTRNRINPNPPPSSSIFANPELFASRPSETLGYFQPEPEWGSTDEEALGLRTCVAAIQEEHPVARTGPGDLVIRPTGKFVRSRGRIEKFVVCDIWKKRGKKRKRAEEEEEGEGQQSDLPPSKRRRVGQMSYVGKQLISLPELKEYCPHQFLRAVMPQSEEMWNRVGIPRVNDNGIVEFPVSVEEMVRRDEAIVEEYPQRIEVLKQKRRSNDTEVLVDE